MTVWRQCPKELDPISGGLRAVHHADVLMRPEDVVTAIRKDVQVRASSYHSPNPESRSTYLD